MSTKTSICLLNLWVCGGEVRYGDLRKSRIPLEHAKTLSVPARVQFSELQVQAALVPPAFLLVTRLRGGDFGR